MRKSLARTVEESPPAPLLARLMSGKDLVYDGRIDEAIEENGDPKGDGKSGPVLLPDAVFSISDLAVTMYSIVKEQARSANSDDPKKAEKVLNTSAAKVNGMDTLEKQVRCSRG